MRDYKRGGRAQTKLPIDGPLDLGAIGQYGRSRNSGTGPQKREALESRVEPSKATRAQTIQAHATKGSAAARRLNLPICKAEHWTSVSQNSY